MKLKIETKKEVNMISGEKERKVLKIEALDYDNLPDDYASDYPYVYVSKCDYRIILLGRSSKIENDILSGTFGLSEFYTYSEEYFQKVMELIKKSVNRLHEINQKQKDVNNPLMAEWSGTEVFKI